MEATRASTAVNLSHPWQLVVNMMMINVVENADDYDYEYDDVCGN